MENARKEKLMCKQGPTDTLRDFAYEKESRFVQEYLPEILEAMVCDDFPL